MIYRLRKRLIRISVLSVIVVVLLIFLGICVIGITQLNRSMDALTDRISKNGGKFPELDDRERGTDRGAGLFITEETPFTTRFFTVRYDASGRLIAANTDFVASVSAEEAREYASQVIALGKERGWIGEYRYKVDSTSMGQNIVFVYGDTNRSYTNIILLATGLVLFASSVIITTLIIVFSKRAVKPVAESYEKQKQFITDANHELKTPLTLILANLDIVESDIGKNEWLDDIRAEGERMSELVSQLVLLTRMDEERSEPDCTVFSLSDAVTDTVSEFATLAEERGKPLSADVQPGVQYSGDEAGIRRIISILLDNAMKYCDEGGEVVLTLSERRHPVICVENTYAEVDSVELDMLFDRFYQANRARTFTGGYGIGLSIAKAIVEKHRGEIRAYRKDDTHIGFRVTLK